jgi:hypothetical protein
MPRGPVIWATSAIGCSVPVSLLACITETSTVLGGEGRLDVGGVEAAQVVDGQVGDVYVVPPLQLPAGGQDGGGAR